MAMTKFNVLDLMDECDEEEGYIIIHNGKQLKSKSGKCAWKTIGHAKNAFHNSASSSLPYCWENPERNYGSKEYWSWFEGAIESGEISFQKTSSLIRGRTF